MCATSVSIRIRSDQLRMFWAPLRRPTGPATPAMTSRLRTALARRDRVEPEQVVLGNGSVELLWLVALATLRPGDRMVVVGPTFGEYARAGRVAGAEVVDVLDPHDAS